MGGSPKLGVGSYGLEQEGSLVWAEAKFFLGCRNGGATQEMGYSRGH